MLMTPSSPFGPAVRYDRVAVAFHWIIAIGIVMQVALGLWMIGIPKQPVGVRAYWFNVHKSIGMTLGMLIVLRLSWRLTHRPPPMPSAMPDWQARAARITHVLLYACMLIQPLAGYLGSVFSGYPIKYFGYTLPAWGWKDEGLKDFFSTVHLLNATTFILLICVHVAAALKHWLIDRDGVFQRMLPRGTARAAHGAAVADQGS
jgi:cytochrome b561